MEPTDLPKEVPPEKPGQTILSAFQEIGQVLAKARQEQNLTIKQVASKIYIRQQYLIALEEGQVSDLPGYVYIFGFIRTYARFLNLDEKELIRRIQKLSTVSDYKHAQALAPLDLEEKPSFLILIVSGVLVVAIAMGGYFFLRPVPVISEESIPDTPLNQQQDEDLAPSESTEVLESQQPVEDTAPMEETVQLTTSKETPNPTASKKFTLIANEPSWVEVRDAQDKVIFMKVLGKGEKYIAPSKPGITMSTGNAGGFDIFWGDTKLPPLGNQGDVKRRVQLESLPTLPVR